jgi:hypothetical protein
MKEDREKTDPTRGVFANRRGFRWMVGGSSGGARGEAGGLCRQTETARRVNATAVIPVYRAGLFVADDDAIFSSSALIFSVIIS